MRAFIALPVLIVLGAAAFGSETLTYTYDARGRLVAVNHTGTVNNNVATTYVYDKADNRTSKITGPSAGGDNVSFTISSNGAATEGTNSVYTVTKSGTATQSYSVNYATANATAVAPGDYTAKSGTLTFTTAQTSQMVSVTTIDDASIESAETFTMALSSPTGGSTIGSPGTATATINDNDSGGGNQPPVANPDSGNTTACGTVTVNVVANDTDPDGNYPLHIAGIVSATKGSVDSFTTTSITYTADVSSGTGVVTYTVADSLGGTSDGTLSINISGGTCQ